MIPEPTAGARQLIHLSAIGTLINSRLLPNSAIWAANWVEALYRVARDPETLLKDSTPRKCLTESRPR